MKTVALFTIFQSTNRNQKKGKKNLFLGVISKSNQGMEAKVKTIFNTSTLQNQHCSENKVQDDKQPDTRRPCIIHQNVSGTNMILYT